MKTAPRNSGKANFGRAILMVALAIMLGSTGCQKEDELMPSTNKSTSESEGNSARALAAIDATATDLDNASLAATNVFTLIKIDHNAAKSELPDYTVVVRSDGMVIYDGHRNVRVKDRVAFRISDATIPALHDIFNRYSFYYLVPEFKVYLDMPLVFTTYQPNKLIRPRTIYDNCYNDPVKLILIRKSVETLLGIDQLVNSTWQNTPSLVQDPSL